MIPMREIRRLFVLRCLLSFLPFDRGSPQTRPTPAKI